MAATATTTSPGPRLKERYDDRDPAAAQGELGLGNVMQVPRLEKIVINMGVGRADPAAVAARRRRHATSRMITGQKPLVTKAKKSIAGFKLREGNADRRQGHAARRPDVGVLRPAGQPGDPPHPRLPRAQTRRRSTVAATTRSASPSS